MKENILLFDGAMGTYYSTCYPDDTSKCEWANINHPERIIKIHNEYIKAGANAIKTNTFAATPKALECDIAQIKNIIKSAWDNASKATENKNCKIFADLCPIDEQKEDVYAVLDEFLNLGATNFLFETLADDTNLSDFTAYIKSKCSDAYIIASFAVTPDGFTRHGLAAHNLIKRVCEDKNLDAVGLNCVSGPLHLLQTTKTLDIQNLGKTFSVMPNAGYPTVIDGRTVFDSSPNYFAERCSELVKIGVNIIGGCCGTTPEHIKQVSRKLDGKLITKNITPVEKDKKPDFTNVKNRLADKMKQGKRIIAVELDPPADSNIEKFMEGARKLKQMGVDAVTIADCPVARVRVDSSLLAAKLHRELDLDPIPHMTCRDRNINATKALLLGLSVEGVQNVLVVTGDPVPSAAKDEVKAVFSFNSVVLADYIRQLSEDGLCSQFCVYGALNVNAKNFDAELRKAVRKQNAGVCAFLTQPVYTERAFENLKKAYDTLDAKILGGIIPIVSHRNALFMSQEMSGIDIPEDIVSMYEGLDRDSAEELAVKLSVDVANRMHDFTDGLYLITPFQRVSLIEKILQKL